MTKSVRSLIQIDQPIKVEMGYIQTYIHKYAMIIIVRRQLWNYVKVLLAKEREKFLRHLSNGKA